MNLEPKDVSQTATGPVNPYAMAQKVPDQEVILETQQFVRRNPGTFEDLHKKVKDMVPLYFDGLRLALNRPLSSHFQTSHNIQLSGTTPSKYSFGSTYIGDKEYRVQETTPVIMAEMDGEGSLNSQIIHSFNKRLRSRFIVQTQKAMWNAMQLETTYFGNDFTASATAVNPNFKTMTGIYVAHYLQRVSPNFDVGAELVHQSVPGAPRPVTITSLGARFSGGSNPNATPNPYGIVYPSHRWTFAATAGLGGWHLSYHRNICEGLQTGVDFEFSAASGMGETSFSYQMDLPKFGMNFKSSIDSSYTVSSIVEKRLQDLPIAFQLSAALNHTKGQSFVGAGLTVG